MRPHRLIPLSTFFLMSLLAGCELHDEPGPTPVARVVSATKSIFSASASTISADGTTSFSLAVTLLDEESKPVPAKTVGVASSRADLIGAVRPTTDADGVATFTIRSTLPGVSRLTATDASDGIQIDQTVSVNFGLPFGGSCLEVFEGKNICIELYGLSSATVRAECQGQTLTYSAERCERTDSFGYCTVSDTMGKGMSASVYYYPPYSNASAQADCSVYHGAVFVPLTPDPGALVASASQSAAVAAPTTLPADGTSRAFFFVTLRDAESHPVPGRAISVTSARGGLDTIFAIEATTNDSGVAAFSIASTTAGTAVITATDATDGFQLSVSITFADYSPPSGVSVGANHACAVVGGAALCWGDNSFGQLGNNSTAASATAVPVQGLSAGVTSVAAGNGFTCAVANGAAYCWGNNAGGQLGSSSAGSASAAPVQVSGLASGVTALSLSSRDHACAVANGAVQCWGSFVPSASGLIFTSVPFVVQGLPSNVTGVATGDSHSCALAGGQVWCWGGNGNGQLGTGDLATSWTPVQVPGPSQVTAIAAGSAITCAVAGGGVQCMGFLANGYGALLSPTAIQGWTSGVTAISVPASGDACAVVNGGAQCWSFGTFGPPSPAPVNGLSSGVTAISAGEWLISGGGTDCAVANGILECWDSGSFGSAGLSLVPGLGYWINY